MHQFGPDGRERLQMRLLRGGESPRASLPFRALLALIALAAVAVALSACGSGGDSSGSGDKQGVVEITCTSCYGSPTDVLLKDHRILAERFNEKYRGRYHVKWIKDPKTNPSNERSQYYQRLALAGDLPDLFTGLPGDALTLGRTGKVMDFAPLLKDDPEWASSFYENAFAGITDDAGHSWGVPQARNAVGIYYNRAIFKQAGVSEFPRTWDEVRVACEKVKAIGKSCFAMDGLWTTLLMWANLIGTQPGGAEFLTRGVRTDDFSGFPEVVRATETLKDWHVEGFANRDAFSGEYQNAATAFITGQSAMIANGPWMVNGDFRSRGAIKGLYENVGYEPSPGWTADGRGMVVSVNDIFLSAATDKRKQEAVLAFVKFAEEQAQSFTQITVNGTYPAVRYEPTAAESKKLEPLALDLTLRSGDMPFTYPTVFDNAPASLSQVFVNLWPAYVRGDFDTQEFLSKFGSDLQSKTG